MKKMILILAFALIATPALAGGSKALTDKQFDEKKDLVKQEAKCIGPDCSVDKLQKQEPTKKQDQKKGGSGFAPVYKTKADSFDQICVGPVCKIQEQERMARIFERGQMRPMKIDSEDTDRDLPQASQEEGQVLGAEGEKKCIGPTCAIDEKNRKDNIFRNSNVERGDKVEGDTDSMPGPAKIGRAGKTLVTPQSIMEERMRRINIMESGAGVRDKVHGDDSPYEAPSGFRNYGNLKRLQTPASKIKMDLHRARIFQKGEKTPSRDW